MKDTFDRDLEIIYDLIKKNSSEINSYYEVLEKNSKKEQFITNFIEKIGLEVNAQSKFAIVSRLVSLRDDSLIQVLKKENFTQERIIQIKEEAYLWVSEFYTNRFENMINEIELQSLLSPFYRALIRGVHDVGIAFSSWQSSWNAHIIDGVNRELYRLFEGDEEKIYRMLNDKNLHDLGHDEERGDRSYSVLVKQGDEFKSISYKEAFENEVNEVVLRLEKFIHNLNKYEDLIYNQKQEIIFYLEAIKKALNETNTNKLISSWADVDRAWMKITTPLQIAHPLEYYEDKYKKAVALEWDLRFANPHINQHSNTAYKIRDMFKYIYNELDIDKDRIYRISLNNLDNTSIYISSPFLYYGAQFNGLLSAQVVPNDEVVSYEMGKKIFAFSENVLESIRRKPKLRIDNEIFDEWFLNEEKELINNSELWHKIYDISTIGHEFGHILWVDKNSESVMNESGNFKNIEEFKATSSGLVAFFLDSQKDLIPYFMIDLIKRAVKLISWMEVTEVESYYCEGLIHLTGLFETGMLSFKEKITIDFSKYDELKDWYIETYKDLVIIYLNKKDASKFLYKFVKKDGKIFKPLNKDVNYFVNYYYDLYKDIGTEIYK